ncbi:MAG: MoaD/ThiS family protein [candidate division KSB1 bacterium]|nr:MoaD/ThiS family protein [candidate division KSB1 bacterium]
MNVQCKFFAGLRRKFGAKERVLELPDGARVGDVLRSLGLSAEESYIVLRNGVHADRGERLADGDVLSLFPLIAGG